MPVEVKPKSERSQSWRSLITNNTKYTDIKWGIKLALNNMGFENNINIFPNFCTFLLKDWLKLKLQQ